jgi:hypothetical protein
MILLECRHRDRRISGPLTQTNEKTSVVRYKKSDKNLYEITRNFRNFTKF